MEKVINIENCMVCGFQLDDIRNELTMTLNFTQKPIYLMIEEFTETSFSDDIVQDAAVCDDCLLKFNEYDEYKKLCSEIEKDVSNMFFSTLNQVKEDDNPVESPPKIEIDDTDDDVLIYHPIEDFNNQIEADSEEMILAQEVADNPEHLVELAEIERKNLPRKFQAIQRGEKQKVVKTRTIKSEKESFTIVQLPGENNLRLYQCEVCNRTFKEKSKLKAHKEIHTTERKVVCPTCGKAFKTAACLRSHKRVHNPTIVECDFCGKTYTQKQELIKHINFVHFNRRDYECSTCKASFGCRGHLKAHIITHQEHKGIRCEICSYTFHTKAKLDRHMKSHTGERDYECGICGKRFLYSYNVSAHIRHVHWKEKRKSDENSSPRTCTLCDQKFSTSLKLRDHLERIHHLKEADETEIIEEDSSMIQYIDENVFDHIES